MSDNRQYYKNVAAEAGTYAAIGFGLSLLERLAMYALQPDVLVEEKAYLNNNREILRKNFTK